MREYCLTVTYKCNWYCNYCIVHTHSRIEPTFINIKNQLNLIDSKTEVSLTGGEPGLASKKVIDYVIAELLKKECIININTNGLFFETYKEYHSVISSYFYHCSEDLKNFVPSIDSDNVEYMIVITDNNIDKLESFLETNKHIQKFTMYGADRTSFQGKEYPGLSKINGMKVFTKYKDRLNDGCLHTLISNTNVTSQGLTKL